MLSSVALYPLVLLWLQALGLTAHPTAQAALGHLLTALLLGQSLRSAALMRALVSPTPVPARQRYQRLARALDRAWLSPARLTPCLVRAALALVAPDPPGSPTAGLTHLALDSVRCGRWEVLTLGVSWHGRVLLVGWAILPSPWPKKTFTPTVCALVRQVAATWPTARRVHLVADRGFPSRRLFQTMRAVGWGWTVRLRAKSWVTVQGQAQWARALLATATVGGWTTYAGASYGSGPQALAGTLAVGRSLPVLAWHQRTAGSRRHRVAQQARRQRHLAGKHPRRAPDASAETAAWVVLFTTHPTWRLADASYRRRWAIEGSYRDAQGGWDGRQGWDLARALARQGTIARAERLVGLWALGVLLQSWVGAQLCHAPAAVRAVARQWTTTGRLSIWTRGRLALAEPSGRLRGWLAHSLAEGAQRVARGNRPTAIPATMGQAA